MANVPHRLTIRLDDDAWATLNRICEVTGVSATAFLQGVVEAVGPVWDANGWRHPLAWDAGDLKTKIVDAVDRAQRIDIERRRRG